MILKKVLPAILAIVLFAAACGSGDEDDATTSTTEPEDQVDTEELVVDEDNTTTTTSTSTTEPEDQVDTEELIVGEDEATTSTTEPEDQVDTEELVVGEDEVQISTGLFHTCAIVETDRSAYCWGRNRYAQLGDGTRDNKDIPTQVKDSTESGDLTNVHSITAGSGHTCAIVGIDRSAYCWGSNDDGELGDGSRDNKNLPTQVKEPTGEEFLTNVHSITAGSDHTCAIVGIDRSAYCWGRNLYGQLGDGTRGDKDIPTQVKDSTESGDLTNVHSITAGSGHTCAIVGIDRSAYCWGSNDDGELGDGTERHKEIPTQVKEPTGSGSLINVHSITAGWMHTCAIVDTDRSAYCWGRNLYGQLGDGSRDNKNLPTQVKDSIGNEFLADVYSIVASQHHTCAIVDTDRSAYCWGENDYGKLGDGTEDHKNLPTQVKSFRGNGALTNVHSITAGSDQTCAIVGADRSAYCWGASWYGLLGDGTEGHKNIPNQVRFP